MATFTDVFKITATLADGRQLLMSASTTHTVTKVYNGTLEPNGDALSGLTTANQPQLDAEPVLLICQYHGGGVGTVNLTNTGAGAAAFNIRHDQSFQIHGTAIFDTDTSAVTATVTEELDVLATDNCPQGGMVRVLALM